MTFPQMTQVLKAVGLESGLTSEPEPVLLTTLHPHSSMRKDLDFPTGPEDRMIPGMCEIQGKASLPASAGTL